MVNRLKKSPGNFTGSTPTDEATSIAAFGFLAREPAYFANFAAQTGLDVTDLAEIVPEPAFLTAVLEFMLADESLLLAFCQSSDFQPQEVHSAYLRLAGPQT